MSSQHPYLPCCILMTGYRLGQVLEAQFEPSPGTFFLFPLCCCLVAELLASSDLSEEISHLAGAFLFVECITSEQTHIHPEMVNELAGVSGEALRDHHPMSHTHQPNGLFTGPSRVRTKCRFCVSEMVFIFSLQSRVIRAFSCWAGILVSILG